MDTLTEKPLGALKRPFDLSMGRVEARRGAQRRRRGQRGLGEPSGARGEAQGPRRRDFRRDTGARGTHPDRVPHTDNFFSKLCLGFFVCSIV